MFAMRITGFILFNLFLLVGLASAQTPTRANVFLGYSYYNTDISSVSRATTYGWEASLEVKMIRWVSMVGDIDTHYGSEGFQTCQIFPNSGLVCSPYTADIIERNFLGGPRVSFPVGNFRPFAEILAGYAHVNAGLFTGTDNSFAAALGGGVDCRISRRIAWRFQGDYLRTQFSLPEQDNVRVSTGKQDNVRLSTGLVLHF